MLLVVDRHNGQPVYRQLMDQIRFQVTSGVLPPGDELPSTRTLSAELGLNPMTVSKAYGLLEREGVVERRPGRALVVSARLAPESAAGGSARTAELAKALAPAVTAARQLGMDEDEAARLFADLLRAANDGDTPTNESHG